MSAFHKKLSGVAASLLLAIFLFSAVQLQAQVIFSEDFQTGFSFTPVDLDSLVPDASVAFVTNAWVRAVGPTDESDTVAVSTSWYDPIGISNDWMISPLIHIDSHSVLSWEAMAYTADYPDGYEVRISTTNTAIASFLANPPLFSTAGEQATWITRTVNFDATSYANQNIYLAFRNNSNDKLLLFVDDILVRNPYQTDARAIALQVPQSSCQLGNSEPISVTIENYGAAPLSNFNVSFVVDDGNSPVTITENVSTTIAPGSTYTYTFTQGANLSAAGTAYAISAFVAATSDGNLSNDSLSPAAVFNVESADLATDDYTTSFETLGDILGWSAEDHNNDSVSWFLAQGGANTGDIFYMYRYNEDEVTPADDWLFSTCVDLTAGTTYELKFSYRVGISDGEIFPEKLKVAVGTSPDAASMTTVLKDLGSLVNDFYQPASISFDVTSAGTYFIGFYCYSDSNEFFLGIDDVTIGEQLPPTASFNTSKDDLEITFLSTSTGADSLHWDFGDDSTSTNGTVVHTYAAPGTYYVCLTATNEVGSITFCDSITVGPTGIALINENEFSVFPNPTQGALVVELNEQVIGKSTLVVSDLVGKKLLDVPVKNTRTTFNLSDRPEGIYFITLQVGESQLRRKVILAR